MKQKILLSFLTFLTLLFFLSNETSVSAYLEYAEVRVINESHEDIYISIKPVKDDSQLPLLENVLIQVGWSKLFLIPPGDYNMVMQSNTVQEPSVVPFTATVNDLFQNTYNSFITSEISDLSNFLYDEGVDFYNKALYKEAINKFSEALTNKETLHSQFGEAKAIRMIGESYYASDQYEYALKYLLPAVEEFENLGEDRYVGRVYDTLSWVYRSLGDYGKAYKYAEGALKIFNEYGDDEDVYYMLAALAYFYNEENEFELAYQYFSQAQTIADQVDDINIQIDILNGWGNFYYRKKQYEEALPYMQKALAFYTTDDRKSAVTIIGNVGTSLRSVGRYEESIPYFEESLNLYKEKNDRDGIGIILTELGRAYEGMGNVSQAILFYQQAVEEKESILNDIRLGDLKSAYANGIKQIFPYARLIYLLQQEQRFEEAFKYIERTRSRGFINQMANGVPDYRSEANPQLLEEESNLRKDIQKLRSQQINEMQEGGSPENNEQIERLEAEYKDLIDKLIVQSPQTAAMVNISTTSMPDFQILLKPDTLTIEYFILSEEEILVYLIDQNSFHAEVLKVNYEQLEDLLKQFYLFPDITPGKADLLNVQLFQMYQWLLQPIEDKVREYKKTNLLIIPHDIVHYVPFAALYNGKEYLIDEYVTYQIPSASVYPLLKYRESPIGVNILAFGNPVTEETFPDIPNSKTEVENIKKQFGKFVTIFTETDASETRLREIAAAYDIIHLAAHGNYNPKNPAFSVISLAKDEKNDGRLTVHEVLEMKLDNTNLVILSACQTQIGNVEKHDDEGERVINRGDEVVAFSRSFFYAGTENVIASLWNADDHSTAKLMNDFYYYLKHDISIAEALRSAQLDIKKDYPNPYYWATFVLTGDGDAKLEQGIVNGAEEEPSDESSMPRSNSCNNPLMALIVFPLVLKIINTKMKQF